jgi:hypothetical protein
LLNSWPHCSQATSPEPEAQGRGLGLSTQNDLTLRPIPLREAMAFVAEHHRHHRPPPGGKYAIGGMRGDELVGVVIVGRPVARLEDDGYTAEVTRLCTLDSELARHAASMLYAAAWRAAKAMGYKRMITYTLASELGISLKAAGWRCVRSDPW